MIAVVSVLQLLGHELESEDLLVYVNVRPCDVHGHLGVPLLTGQTVADDAGAVTALVDAVPTGVRG